MEIKEKVQELELPLEYATGSFAATINYLDLEEAKKIKNYLTSYGVRITKASEIKYYLCNELEIREILSRLQWCKDNGITLVDENGNNKDFVFNKITFYENFPNASITDIIPDVLRDKEMINENMLNSLDIDVTVGLTEESYDRYVELESLLINVSQVLNGSGEIEPEVTNSLIKLISDNNQYSDSEILFASLVYKQNRSAEEIERISNAIKEVMDSRNQGGSLNL